MGAFLSFLYGLIAYGASLAALLYLIGFSGNGLVPKSVDSGAFAPLAKALCVNILLLGLFAAQHSVMARRAFKRSTSLSAISTGVAFLPASGTSCLANAPR